ncbi:extended synaptotagmin-2 [Tribolium castaneum]|nr:PREDICTED: extended synaptotagmin-2 isoform X1 [Tribolium castaneum]XP_015835814.1 PREDICTED: extended synaptotagmin-2 isoform X1 [Tribolium castaneum]XP_015835815.1 PREDICTED: extended synaptotagmin-2 isoform X1 [Tribolium castaneum]|eukprot:XP_008193857.1 PREDICTED: extended synaptotagmin-2 isoform X1 [Tribolium castaneum]
MTESDNLIPPLEPEIQLGQLNGSAMKKRFFVIKIFYKAILIFVGYAISYMQWSFILLFVTAGTLIWLEQRDNTHASKIKVKATACSFTKQDLVRRIDEIPSWVKFPDRERAEWLNQVIAQLWPTVESYIVKLFRTSIQTKIRKKYDSFQFESIDFGPTPPKIDGIKVYTAAATTDSIIIDFDVFYDGDCDINFSFSGAEIGGIRDFQLSVEVRVVLKPLLPKVPLIGGIQIYFLNTPDINFTLEGLSGIPGLSSFIRSKIEEKITKKIVFPNKITKRFSKSVAPSELKALEPAGVLRVHVFEAKDLMAKDITGKSDPYVILYVGAQERKSNTVNQCLNPKWDYWCEFVIIDPKAQHLGFKLYDRDNVNEDDFLGSGEVDIASVLKGQTDQWITLDSAKHGAIHLRFTWLSLSSDLEDLDEISRETKLLQVDHISTALLTIYVDTATKLPEAKRLVKPHPYFILTLRDQKEKSRVKKHTNDPCWEQGFVMLVPNPLEDSLHMAILDKPTGSLLTQFSYKISDLMQLPDLEISKKEFILDNEESKVVLSLQLRILTNESYKIEDESESDSEGGLSRQSSLEETSVKSRGSFRNSPKKILEDVLSKTSVSPQSAKPPIQRTPSVNEHRLGRLEISLEYNEPRQKLLVTVHRVSNLPLKDPSDIPDPYVRIKMYSQGHTTGPTYRTKVVTDNCNPVYEETFEYLFSKSDAYEQTLVATVKSKKFLHNNTMGQVEINLKYVNLSERYREWFDLCPKSS